MLVVSGFTPFPKFQVGFVIDERLRMKKNKHKVSSFLIVKF